MGRRSRSTWISGYLILLCSVAFADKVDVRVTIEDNINGNQFRDAIYYKDMDEYNEKIKDGTYDTQRQKRIDTFRNAVTSEPREVTKEELETQADDLRKQLDSINEEILEKG